jgi:hypothetical protein
MLITDADWQAVAQTIPIQPHMGNFMIGFPASTRNTVNALQGRRNHDRQPLAVSFLYKLFLDKTQ